MILIVAVVMFLILIILHETCHLLLFILQGIHIKVCWNCYT